MDYFSVIKNTLKLGFDVKYQYKKPDHKVKKSVDDGYATMSINFNRFNEYIVRIYAGDIFQTFHIEDLDYAITQYIKIISSDDNEYFLNKEVFMSEEINSPSEYREKYNSLLRSFKISRIVNKESE